MPQSLQRVAYSSVATVSMDSLLTIADILAVSQRNNARDRLTGALAYSDGRFFQVIEGGSVDVERLMRRVEGDSRHSDIRVVSSSPVEERLFKDWSMSAPRISPEMAPLLKKAVDESQTSPATAIELMLRIATEDGIHSR